MSDQSFLRGDLVKISVRFTGDKIDYLLRKFPRQTNSIIITGSDYWKGFFEYSLKNSRIGSSVLIFEKEETKESIDKRLKKLEKPYILITDYFCPELSGEWEYMVYFNSPLRISGLVSDIRRVENRKGMSVEVLCDWRGYEDFYTLTGEEDDREDIDAIHEWLSRSCCRISMIDGSGGECGVCDYCSSRGTKGLTETEISLLALLRTRGKAFTRDRLFELGYGTHRHDSPYPGYGALRGIRMDDALAALFTLKNRGLVEFSGWGKTIFIRGI
ncbi:MAG: hypothetical protein HPY53_15390 [Brevinematales bacterium]|nr:hypothetical protein [Brevinematales bacterium]